MTASTTGRSRVPAEGGGRPRIRGSRRPPRRLTASTAWSDAGLRAAVVTDRWSGRVTDRVLRSVAAAGRRRRDDRGDVPGWVLVTLMTAGLVTVLWVLARDRLTQVFERAIASVVGQ
jgi:hypothetical protein